MERTMPRDYYEILGVPRNASKDDLKRAFRNLARQYHPDVNNASDAEDRFKEINEAYRVLNDDQQRAAYDRYGHAGVNGGFTGGFSGGFPGIDEIFEELFGSFGGFSRGGRRRGPVAGRDLRHDMRISFEQAVFGAEVEVELARRQSCEECGGSGAEPGSKPKNCPECNGTGQVRRMQQAFGFNMVNVVDCPRCNGRGKLIEHPCAQCGGSGSVVRNRILSVTIPPGVDDGTQIRLAGEGEPSSSGGPHGDLYVVLQVTAHEFFKRRNNDVVVEMSINVAQAALGDVVEVPTVDGPAEITIPSGTQSGKVVRLREKGVPKLRRDGSTSGRGDQLVILNVDVPTRLTKEQRELFEQLGRTLGSEVMPQKNGKGFLDRVADFFSG